MSEANHNLIRLFGQEEDHGQGIQMRIFLTGVSCVGKTTIGKKMGKLLGVRFFEKALVHLLNRPESLDCLIAMPPSGLMGGYQRANLQVDISGLDQDQAARKVKEAVEELDGKLKPWNWCQSLNCELILSKIGFSLFCLYLFSF